jgi:dihydrodipicolinate synthase/N-acetylneuraminate lyase
MSHDLPHGAFAPVPTPFGAGGGIEPAAMRNHLAWLESEGLSGALILGTNGEFPSLTFAEKKAVAYAASRGGRGKLQLMLCVGSCALPETLELLAVAVEYGFDSVLCPPPWYFRHANVAGLAEFFKRVLDAAKLPVLLYHFPQMMGVPISDELLAAIGPHERLIGFKDSSGDESELARLARHFPGKACMVGSDKLVAACSRAGGAGSITAAANVVPDLVASIAEHPSQQAKLNAVRGTLEKFGLGPAVKAILRKKGFGAYAARPPLTNLAGAQEQQLFAMLTQTDSEPHNE